MTHTPHAQTKKAKFITPPNALKKKAGSGGLPESILKNAQNVMNHFENDFRPEARKLLKTFTLALMESELALRTQTTTANRDSLIFPIMQLKANGGMFKFNLLSDVADICLQFMENLEHYNRDALDVIRIHEHTIEVIISRNLRGNGGDEGYSLVQELHKACLRYLKKYKTQEKL